MNNNISDILNKNDLSKTDIIELLKADSVATAEIIKFAGKIKSENVGNKVYYRGLIEFSNKCRKDCLYCGIRASNVKTERYDLSDEEILAAANYAYLQNYASIVLQGGERNNAKFVSRISELIKKIKNLSNNNLGITLSLGEQSENVYREWFTNGAHRYLLRIESSDKDLYNKLHPNNNAHCYETRLEAIKTLKKIGFQTGTGVMIGTPFQTIENLANDLLFFKQYDIDMVGMGPYIEHTETPLYQFKDTLLPLKERFNLSIKMIAILRIMLKDINIAATTALQAIDPVGREKALKAGANIIMPNITPTQNRKNYLLYENKPCIDEQASDCNNCLEARIKMVGDSVAYGEWGDSVHFTKKGKNK